MQKTGQIISRIGLFLTTILFTIALFINAPNPAEADTAGSFEAGVAFGYAGDVDADESDLNGFTFTLDFGYRITEWAAVMYEQDFGGLVFDEYGVNETIFYGASMFEGKFIYSGISNLDLYGKIGIGAVYVADSEDGYDFNYSWFGLRLGIGATYYFTNSLGAGLNFDYTPSFKDDHVDHFLRFQVHCVFLF